MGTTTKVRNAKQLGLKTVTEEDYRVHLIKPQDIEPADYNPPKRIEPRFLAGLTRSILEVGRIIYPILCFQGNKNIDGHRRKESGQNVGMDLVPVLYVDPSLSPEQVYRVINATQRKMNANDQLGAWLRCQAVASKEMHKAFTAMKDVLGKKLVEDMYEDGYSIHTFNWAKRLARYCDLYTPHFTRKATKWLMNTAPVHQVRLAMERGVDRAILKKALDNNQAPTFA